MFQRRSLVVRTAAAAVVVLAIAILALSNWPPVRAQEGNDYRVEMVQNDPYKVQLALNTLADQGWVFMTSIPRNDNKVNLVFHRGR